MSGYDHWFEPLADHMGAAYLRYSFTKGTVQEVGFIIEALDLAPRSRILDVGCGPGRHAHEFARRGFRVHGIDISRRFIEIARTAGGASGAATGGASGAAAGRATFERMDARSMTFVGEFDAVICLCQGAFGLMTAAGDDAAVVAGMSRALRPGGRLALSSFNAYFAVKYHDDADFDAGSGVSHERTEIRSASGEVRMVDLWTGCYTPRELRLLLGAHDFAVDSISCVEPGAYAVAPATTESPEFLTLATRNPRPGDLGA